MPDRPQPLPNDQSSSEFNQFVVKRSKIGCRGLEATHNEVRYLPDAAREEFFSDKGRLRRVLLDVFPKYGVNGYGILPVLLKDVQARYSKVFATLLWIGKGRAIADFVESDNLADDKLPFQSRPVDFPPPENFKDELWNLFYENQWMFCAPKMRYARRKTWHPNTILPFERCEELGAGRSGRTFRIEVNPSHDELLKDQNNGIVACCNGSFTAPSIAEDDENGHSHSYVVKMFHTNGGELQWKNELLAMIHTRRVDGVIGFYGCYSHGSSSNIILEYANAGTLEEYFKTVPPPVSVEDCYQFWTSMTKLVGVLEDLGTLTFHEDENKFQVWHFDIKPLNILVCQGTSTYSPLFKLADFGSSLFRVKNGDQSPRSKHSVGTRTYGPPECYQWNQLTGKSLQRPDVTPAVDVWSLGCIFSEAATWVLRGLKGVTEYRQNRIIAHKNNPKFEDSDCFHNGWDLLDFVRMHHDYLRYPGRNPEATTLVILGIVDKHMLLARAEERLATRPLLSLVGEELERTKSQLFRASKSNEGISDSQSHTREGSQAASRAIPVRSKTVPPQSQPRSYHGRQSVPGDLPGLDYQPPSHFPCSDDALGLLKENTRLSDFEGGRRDGIQCPSSRETLAEESTQPRLIQDGRLHAVVNEIPTSNRQPPVIHYHRSGTTLPPLIEKAPQFDLGHGQRDEYNSRYPFPTSADDPFVVQPTQIWHAPNGKRPITNPASIGSLPGSPPISHEAKFTQSIARSHLNSPDRYSDSAIHHQSDQHYFAPGVSPQESINFNSTHRPTSLQREEHRDLTINEHDLRSYYSPDPNSFTGANHKAIPQMSREADRSSGPPHWDERSTVPLGFSIPQKRDAEPRQSPPRWELSDAYAWRSSQGRHALPKRCEPFLEEMKDRDYILLVDNSSTMRKHWQELKQIVDLITYVVKRWDNNGVDLMFTISKDEYNGSSATEIVRIVDKYLPPPTTSPTLQIAHMQSCLDPILRKYRQKAEKRKEKRWSLKISKVKKTILFIFTDGRWQPESSPENLIREFVKTLPEYDLPDSQFGIQFIRFGNDQAGVKLLEDLDDIPGLNPDIVDTEPANNGNVLKMLVGSINNWFDHSDIRSTMPSSLSSFVQHGQQGSILSNLNSDPSSPSMPF